MKTSAIGLSMLCCVVLLATGCGKGELVTEAEGLRDEMCECKDADCVTPVFEKIHGDPIGNCELGSITPDQIVAI